ncbi:MAG: aldo/keto reductase, partial [Rhizobiaceae bacterium]|nr:aldo/keto reductase [Rhizobiaceae bacterium]
SDVPVSRLGMGCSQFGNFNRVTTDEVCQSAVDAAWEAGIRYFDTAPHYGLGLSERRLGRALRGRRRDDYVISTKVGRLLVPSPEGADRLDDAGFLVPADHRRVFDFSRDGVLRSFEQSLDRLGTDRVDIVYLHDPDDHWAVASSTGIDTLIELRDQGVIGAVGAGMNQSPLLADLVRRADVDIVMLAGRWTLLDQSAADDLLPLAHERGVRVLAAGIYNSGLLAAPTVSDEAHYDYRPAPAALVRRARRMAELCSRHGVTLPDAAVQFPVRHPAVAGLVVGMRTAAHVRSLVTRWTTHVPDALWDDLVAEGLLPSATFDDSERP